MPKSQLSPGSSLKEAINSSVYQSYSYSYPHKTAYQKLETPINLSIAWEYENKNALFLYLHIPFCEMRCGFCNLFSLSRPERELTAIYLKQIEQQAKVFKENVSPFQIDQFAVGGGTPSLLTEKQIHYLFTIMDKQLSMDFINTPGSFEVSPQTINKEKLSILKNNQVNRISIGIQTFIPKEAGAIGRPQNIKQSLESLDLIKQFNFETFNIDLIYGIPGQQESDFLYSLKKTVFFQPEEIYLYPLYIRELTGIWNANERNSRINSYRDSDQRTRLYQLGRDFLISQGYQQVSMRMFQKPATIARPAPDYCCQDDGMFGLGAGARSYTRALHYSFDYSVKQKNVQSIIEDYVGFSAEDFSKIQHGIPLSEDEQKRRFIIQSILLAEGFDVKPYLARFSSAPFDDFPQLNELLQNGLARIEDTTIRLTAEGLMYSDAIGPWLNSDTVKQRMQNYTLC